MPQTVWRKKKSIHFSFSFFFWLWYFRMCVSDHQDCLHQVVHERLGELLRVLKAVISKHHSLNSVEILSAAGTLIAKIKGTAFSHSPPLTLIRPSVEEWGRDTYSLEILFLNLPLTSLPPLFCTPDWIKIVTSNDKPKIAWDNFPAMCTKLSEMHATIRSFKKRDIVSQASHRADIGKSEQCMSANVFVCVCVCVCMCVGKRLLGGQCPCQSRGIPFHSVPRWEISISMHGVASLGLWTRISEVSA